MSSPIPPNVTDTPLIGSVLLGFGSNLAAKDGRDGDGPTLTGGAVFIAAIKALELVGLNLVAHSRLFVSPPWPLGHKGPDYCNSAALFSCAPSKPMEILEICQKIEHQFGRVRLAHQRYGPRSLDIDILLMGARPDDPILAGHYHSDELMVPHPQMAHRAFVLGPLLDVLPDWHWPNQTPLAGQSAKEAYRQLLEANDDGGRHARLTLPLLV